MNYNVIEREEFTVVGKTATIFYNDRHISIPLFWEDCKKDGTIEELQKLNGDCTIMGVGEEGCNNNYFKYMIGVEMPHVNINEKSMQTMKIPKSTWVVFEPVLSEPQYVIPIWEYIFNEFLPNGKYKFAGTPDLEVNKKIDNGKYTCEIWIPVIENLKTWCEYKKK